MPVRDDPPEPDPVPDPAPEPAPDPEPLPPEPEPAPDPTRQRAIVYLVTVFRQDAQDVPLQRLGYADRAALGAGFRQLALYWAPYRASVPAGVTVYDTVRDTWVDPHTDEPLETPPPDGPPGIIWFDVMVKVGNGDY